MDANNVRGQLGPRMYCRHQMGGCRPPDTSLHDWGHRPLRLTRWWRYMRGQSARVVLRAETPTRESGGQVSQDPLADSHNKQSVKVGTASFQHAESEGQVAPGVKLGVWVGAAASPSGWRQYIRGRNFVSTTLPFRKAWEPICAYSSCASPHVRTETGSICLR